MPDPLYHGWMGVINLGIQRMRMKVGKILLREFYE
jgi:hypothetical protein